VTRQAGFGKSGISPITLQLFMPKERNGMADNQDDQFRAWIETMEAQRMRPSWEKGADLDKSR
jgi:hypothetical protein